MICCSPERAGERQVSTMKQSQQSDEDPIAPKQHLARRLSPPWSIPITYERRFLCLEIESRDSCTAMGCAGGCGGSGARAAVFGLIFLLGLPLTVPSEGTRVVGDERSPIFVKLWSILPDGSFLAKGTSAGLPETAEDPSNASQWAGSLCANPGDAGYQRRSAQNTSSRVFSILGEQSLSDSLSSEQESGGAREYLLPRFKPRRE
jgi:hypothetical protein